MKRKPVFIILSFFLILSFAFPALAADSYDASTMRLLRHEGTVEIFDAAGEPRFLMDNVRFISGESMRTGSDGQASVSLDDTKIVSLDKDTRVEFIQESGHMQLNLLEGSLFLDVQKKLDENESFDIQTTTMTVGIRGTLIFATESSGSDGAPPATTIGVMEGGGRVTFTDSNGSKRVVDVAAGQKIVIPKDKASEKNVAPVVSNMTKADIAGFVADTVLADDKLTNRVVEGSENGAQLLLGAPGEQQKENQEQFPADGDWTWGGTITIVAQSASKLYDGKPLSRTSDALVYGLPSNFGISVTCSGSITNAGSTDNIVSTYSITNSSGEGVTGHFSNIRKVNGTLVVDPAPLVVWTGSDEKVYDGEPLTCEEAGIRTVPGHESGDPAWKNTSLVTQTALGSQTMVALSGRTYVHGTNPLTGEVRQIELKAGQTLSVCLHDKEDGQTLEFQVDSLKEKDLPEEVLRIYAKNPALLAQACEEAGWDPDVMSSLIAALPPADSNTVRTGTGLKVSDGDQGNVMTDSTNVRIHIDSGITNYSTRALTGEEANFTPITLDPSIKVTATGSQTEVGESDNTYTIDWGSASESNYVLREDLGTLTVLEPEKEITPPPDPDPETPTPTPAPTPEPEITITAPTAEKVYDGTPLTAGSAEVEGVPDGYTVRAAVSGSQTAVGSSASTVTSYTIVDDSGNDVTSEFGNVTVVSGTLTVKPLSLNVDCGGGNVPYSGTVFNPQPVLSYNNGTHSGESVDGSEVVDSGPSITGNALGFLAAARGTTPRRLRADKVMVQKYTFTLFTGDTVELILSGMGTEVGTYTLTGTLSSSIEANLSLNLSGTELVIEPCEITVSTGSDEKVYDGTPLVCDDYTITGMPDGQEIALEFTADIVDAGTVDNTFEIVWFDLNPDNYKVTEEPGTLTVKPIELSLSLNRGDGQVTYGKYTLATPTLNGNEPATASENPNGPFVWYMPLESSEDETVTLSLSGGLQPDSPVREEPYVTSYSLAYSGNASNYKVKSVKGTTTTVMPAVINISSAEYTQSKTYDGDPCDSSDFAEEFFDVEGYEGINYMIIPIYDSDVYEARQLGIDIDWGDEDEHNFQVNYDAGTFEIKPRDLTIHTYYNYKVYDGQPLTRKEADVSGLLSSEEITLTFTGSQTEVGSSDNTFEIIWDTAKAKNYNVIPDLEQLVVDPLPITLSSATIEEENFYGTLTNGDHPLEGLEQVYSWDHLIVEFTGSVTLETVGTASAQNTFTITGDATSLSHYRITKEYGHLLINNSQQSSEDPLTTDTPPSPDPENTDDSFGLFSAFSSGDEDLIDGDGLDDPDELDETDSDLDESDGELDESDGELDESDDELDESDGEPDESDDEPDESDDEPDESDDEPDESDDDPDKSDDEPDESDVDPDKSDDKPQEPADDASDESDPSAASSDGSSSDTPDNAGNTRNSGSPKVSDTRSTPDVPDTPADNGGKNISDVSDTSDGSNVTDTPDTSDVPNDTDVLDGTEDPVDPDATDDDSSDPSDEDTDDSAPPAVVNEPEETKIKESKTDKESKTKETKTKDTKTKDNKTKDTKTKETKPKSNATPSDL